jgi:hypothetical protein
VRKRGKRNNNECLLIIIIKYLMKMKKLYLAFTLLVVACAEGEESSDSDKSDRVSASGNYFQEKFGA